jgi:hypothetical protein
MIKRLVKKDKIAIDGVAYLAHPCDTYGERENNVKDSILIKERLVEKFKLSVMNPLSIITPGPNFSWEKCMEQCKSMLRACDALILGPKWYLSRGCRMETEWAMEWQMPIYIYLQETEELNETEYEVIQQILNTKDIYIDSNISIKHDDNFIYINYFGNQYTFSKSKKQIIIPENDDAMKVPIAPEDYLEDVGRGISLYSQLPEEFQDLLSPSMDYAFFFGQQDQLCLKSDSNGNSIYMNKYCAFVLKEILRYFLDNGSTFPSMRYIATSYDNNHGANILEGSYYIDNKGNAVTLNSHRLDGLEQVIIHYFTQEKRITISKGRMHFELTPLETYYLYKLLEENNTVAASQIK